MLGYGEILTRLLVSAAIAALIGWERKNAFAKIGGREK